MDTFKEQERRRSRQGRWRRISISAGLALTLLATAGGAAGPGLFASGSTASAAMKRPVESTKPAPKGSVKATEPSQAHVWGGWRAPKAQVGRVAQLSAGGLPQAAPGARVGYHWRIVSKPTGSRARLTGASSAHPTLRPDRPGRYVLRVTTGEIPAGAKAGARSLCARGCSSRQITLTAAIAAGPLGLPVDTIAGQNEQWGVQVGDPGTPGAEFYAAPVQTDALQVVVLDRSTLALASNESYANDWAGAGQMEAAISRLSSSDLVIITRPDFDNNAPTNSTASGAGAAANNVNYALAEIGAPPVPQVAASGQAPLAWNTTSGTCSEFSAIGIPGLPGGQGHTSGCQVNTTHSATALRGYFRQDLSEEGNYMFVDDTRVPFDTGDPSADPAVVTVGSDEAGSVLPKATYTSENLSGGAGFFVVVLDSGSLKLEDQGTFSDDTTGLANMQQFLTGWDDDPQATIIVRSIGKVGAPVSSDTAAVQWWDQIASEIEHFGGSQFYFEVLNGDSNSEYASVGIGGAIGYPNQTTQVATAENSGGGRLTGLLAYNDANEFYPSESYDPSTLEDASRPLAGTLPGIIALPPSAWPDRDTHVDQNVLACVAQNLPGAHLQMPIESNYPNLNLESNWAGWASDIGQPSFYQTIANDSACGLFTQAEAEPVIKQLQTEWNDVAIVDTFIADMQKPLVDSQGNPTEIQSITEAVDNDLATSSAHTTVDSKAVASDMLWLVSSLPGVDAISGPLNVLAAGLGLADDYNDNDSGVNLPDDQIATTGATLGAQLEQQYKTSIGGLGSIGDILVSDWTKLQDAAQNAADSPGAAADWSFTDKQLSQTANVLLLTTRRTAYETLFPLAYYLYRLSAGDAPGSANDLTSYTCAYFEIHVHSGSTYSYTVSTWLPFAGVPTEGGVEVAVSGDGALEQWAYATSDDTFVHSHGANGQFPGATLLSQLFDTPQNDPIQTGPLFNPLQFAVETYDNATTNTETVTHISQSVANSSGGGASSKLVCQAS
ncbi:MAG: hypothetical protein ACLP01_29705 [Solirubrobacteraceae bacterium]